MMIIFFRHTFLYVFFHTVISKLFFWIFSFIFLGNSACLFIYFYIKSLTIYFLRKGEREKPLDPAIFMSCVHPCSFVHT